MLSIKGREPFIRMQLWLNDPHNIEKLQYIKNERRDPKRQRSLENIYEKRMDHMNALTNPFNEGSSKKARLLLNEKQKEALNIAFALNAYPNLSTIEFLSDEVNISGKTVSNWFHNQRMRNKQMPPSPPSYPNDFAGTTFDPDHFRMLLSQRLNNINTDNSTTECPDLSPDSGNDDDKMHTISEILRRKSGSPYNRSFESNDPIRTNSGSGHSSPMSLNSRDHQNEMETSSEPFNLSSKVKTEQNLNLTIANDYNYPQSVPMDLGKSSHVSVLDFSPDRKTNESS